MTRSRRSRARVPEVFIDASKKEVTNYDGGKTTVLTGGVMLGASKPAKPAASSTGNNNNNWRRPRW
jgi:protein Tob/BTG